ncbi:hypothetical protein [Flavobacterium fluviatile]|uniref:hypothetical protein n=1 Tax=Flavobacterium fluviatile TaxID=1862387 RepID=UPI0013D7FDD9|nr:hypothetical protein [Flavobacterium fluviatile]
MITDNERNYNQDDYDFNPDTQDNQSYVEQYQQENSEEENLLKQDETPEPPENENLDTEFSNALDLDDFENDFDENDSEGEEDPEQNEKEENYDQQEIAEPETFADDGYKID